MVIELRAMGLAVYSQSEINVYYRSEEVGIYFADLVVEDNVICELKSAEGIAEEHERQLLNYLKATTVEVGLLLNFGPKPQFKRKVFMNQHKHP
jgi:GxxExxY protein